MNATLIVQLKCFHLSFWASAFSPTVRSSVFILILFFYTSICCCSEYVLFVRLSIFQNSYSSHDVGPLNESSSNTESHSMFLYFSSSLSFFYGLSSVFFSLSLCVSLSLSRSLYFIYSIIDNNIGICHSIFKRIHRKEMSWWEMNDLFISIQRCSSKRLAFCILA